MSQESLMKKALEAKTEEKRLKAIKKLKDQDVLFKVADRHYRFYPILYEAALNKITNQSMLANLAKKEYDEKCSLCAAKRLIDQTFLADVAKNAGCASVAEYAVGKLNDQVLLADVFINSKYRYSSDGITEIVAKKLDQTVLADIAKSNDDWLIRDRAIKYITDRNVLKDIAQNDKTMFVRIAASAKLIDRINDMSILADIVKYGSISIEDRQKALRKINDLPLLIDIAKNIGDMFGVQVVKKIGNQAALEDIAKTAEDYEVRSAAYNKLEKIFCDQVNVLDDQLLLADIAKNNDYLVVRNIALEKLMDQTALADVSKKAKDSDTRWKAEKKLTEIRVAATEKLTDPKALAEIIQKDDISSVRWAAFIKLRAMKGISLDNFSAKQMNLLEIALDVSVGDAERKKAAESIDPELIVMAVIEYAGCHHVNKLHAIVDRAEKGNIICEGTNEFIKILLQYAIEHYHNENAEYQTRIMEWTESDDWRD